MSILNQDTLAAVAAAFYLALGAHFWNTRWNTQAAAGGQPMQGWERLAIGVAGTARVDVAGVAGPGCEAIVDRLAEALQADVVDRTRKPDYWRQRVLPATTMKVGR